MLRKNILIVLLVSFFNGILAQDTQQSIFHNPPKTNISKKQTSESNYAIYFNPSFALRGGATFGFQYHIYNGFSIWVEYGNTLEDILGKISFDNSLSNKQDYFSEVTKNTLGTITEFGIKRYFNGFMDGVYFGIANTNIRSSVERTINEYYFSNQGLSFTGNSAFNLDYKSNEYKVLFGYTSDNYENFFVDYYLGIGVRKIQNPELLYDTIYSQNSYKTYVYKKANNNIKAWLFPSLKIGYKF